MISPKTTNWRIATRLAVGFGALLMLAVRMAAVGAKALIGGSVKRFEAGSRPVGDAGTTMSEIVASVRRVANIVGEISGIGQVSSAVAQLDRMTQQNAALVEPSAAAAESLKDQAARLNGLVGTFRLGTQGA